MTEKEVHSPAVLRAETVARAKAGDREALGQIYEATSTEIYRTIHAMVRDEQTVLDIQQDVYVQAFSHLDQLREPDSLRPWLRQIAVNRVRLQFREEKPLLFTELSPEDDGPVPDFPDLHEEGAPALELEKKETARLVRQILDKLSDGQRLLIGMYYYEQMPVKKIAENLGISEGAVKVQLYRGRKKVETEVRRLEEEGVKLYGLSPLPFVVALLRRLVPMERAEKAVLTGALERSGAAAALQTTLPFFQSALGRVVIGLGIAVAIGGGIAGGRWLNSHRAVRHDAPTAENVLRINAGDPTLPSDRTGPAQPTGPDLPVDPTETEVSVPETPTAPVVTEPPVTAPGASQPAPPEAEGPGAEDGNSDPGTGLPDSSGDETSGEPSISWWSFWPFSENSYDLQYQRSANVYIATVNGGVPELYSDNPAVIEIKPNGGFTGGGLKLEEAGYMWTATSIGPGNARVLCALDGEIYQVFTVTNPEHPPKLVSAKLLANYPDGYAYNVNDRLDGCVPGICKIDLIVEGDSQPEIITDRPDVVEFSRMQPFFGGGIDQWYKHGYFASGQIFGAGDAHVYVKLNGETVYTFTIHAIDSDEPDDPTEETSQNPETP